jgi:2-(1,2-epoxy-1,2-dihydrophenyl)acetyl-CoA isomerase
MNLKSELVLSRRDGAVGTLSLNRPASLNTFNLEMARQFLAVVEDFRCDEQIRVVVVRGVGRVFSAGGDIPEMLGYVREGRDRAAYFREPLAAFGQMVLALQNLPKPVVAAVHGAVAGFAFNLMLACDLKLAEEMTRFNQAFIKVGLSPDGGGTWFLPRYIGYAHACELALLPTELDAKTAQEWGLINWIAPADRRHERILCTGVGTRSRRHRGTTRL